MKKSEALVKIDIARSKIFSGRNVNGTPIPFPSEYYRTLAHMTNMDKRDLAVYLVDNDLNIQTAARILIKELESK